MPDLHLTPQKTNHDPPPYHPNRPPRALAEPYPPQPAVIFNAKPAAPAAETYPYARRGNRPAAADGVAVFPPRRQRAVSARLGNAAV